MIIAVDPGRLESGWCVVDPTTLFPTSIGKSPNDDLRGILTAARSRHRDRIVIEMIASYGMPVGVDVFETVRWVGRFEEMAYPHPVELVYRRDVKLHLCHSAKASDANVVQALVDRFASGVRNRGKGTKAFPGWFYGFKGDAWQAYALAVYAVDRGRDVA